MGKVYPDVTKRLLNNFISKGMNSYPLALLIIHMSAFGWELVVHDKLAKSHFYNRVALITSLSECQGQGPEYQQRLLNLFYEFCLCLVVDFDSAWTSSPIQNKSIFSYKEIRTDFDTSIKNKLKKQDTLLLMSVRTI